MNLTSVFEFESNSNLRKYSSNVQVKGDQYQNLLSS